MADLTDRQVKILRHIIEEYIETAQPVGSLLLERKFNLGVSPATLRNEMAELTRLGYLTQPHTSAGRSPSPMGLKFYVSNLMQAKDLSVTDEVKIKEKVWDFRSEFDKALRQATKELADSTKQLAVAATDSGDIFYSGTANILDMPEFYDIDLTRNVLSLLDHFEYLNRIFSHEGAANEIQVLLSDDIGYDPLSTCAVVFARFGQGKSQRGAIGIVGPCRLNYPRLIPTVRYVGGLLDEVIGSWR